MEVRCSSRSYPYSSFVNRDQSSPSTREQSQILVWLYDNLTTALLQPALASPLKEASQESELMIAAMQSFESRAFTMSSARS